MGGCKKMINENRQDHYYSKNYDSKKRFISYWYQIYEITSKNPTKILEIGIGNKFVSDYLKKYGFNVITVDIDKRLNPDVVASIDNIPFNNDEFDIIACFEVLEHQEFYKLSQGLKELKRVSKKFIVISLPDVSNYMWFRLPFFDSFIIPVPSLKKRTLIFDREHYWEIGKKDYPLSLILNNIKKAGLKILNTYRIPENPYHRYFCLKK